MRFLRTTVGVLLSLLLVACGASRPARLVTPPTIALLVRGDAQIAAQTRDALLADRTLPIELRAAELPAVAAPVAPNSDPRIADARARYTEGDFVGCLRALEDPGLVSQLLHRNDRNSAARVLLFRVACHAGALEFNDARQSARMLAVLSLPVPDEVHATSVRTESLLAETMREVSDEPTLSVRVETPAVEAVVHVDGNPAVCTTPCTLPLRAGSHALRLDADGYASALQTLDVSSNTRTLSVVMTPATPELAAQQWTQRHAQSASADSEASLRLLSRAVRARGVTLVLSELVPGGIRLRASLAQNGALLARAERRANSEDPVATTSRALLRELLVQGRLLRNDVPFYRNGYFWVSVGAGVVAVVVSTTAILLTRPIATQVVFGAPYFP